MVEILVAQATPGVLVDLGELVRYPTEDSR